MNFIKKNQIKLLDGTLDVSNGGTGKIDIQSFYREKEMPHLYGSNILIILGIFAIIANLIHLFFLIGKK